MEDMNLDEIAEQELLNEAKRGAARASVYGALGWQKCPLKPTNKVFLQNILLSTLSAKRRRDADSDSQTDSPKRRLLDSDFRDADNFRNRVETDRKPMPDERQTLIHLRDSETLNRSSRKSNEKERTSTGQKYSRSSSSTVELHPFRKRRKEHSSTSSSRRRRRRSSSKSSSSKSFVSAKHHKDSKKLSPKKHRH